MNNLPVIASGYLPADVVVFIGGPRRVDETVEQWRARATCAVVGVGVAEELVDHCSQGVGNGA